MDLPTPPKPNVEVIRALGCGIGDQPRRPAWVKAWVVFDHFKQMKQ